MNTFNKVQRLVRLLLVFVCANSAGQVVETKQINQCLVGQTCVIEGKMVATDGMGRIEDITGCIAIALPGQMNDDWNLGRVRAIGYVYEQPNYPGLVTYKIRDRTFDAESCYDGYAMYVDRIERVH